MLKTAWFLLVQGWIGFEWLESFTWKNNLAQGLKSYDELESGVNVRVEIANNYFEK